MKTINGVVRPHFMSSHLQHGRTKHLSLQRTRIKRESRRDERHCLNALTREASRSLDFAPAADRAIGASRNEQDRSVDLNQIVNVSCEVLHGGDRYDAAANQFHFEDSGYLPVYAFSNAGGSAMAIAAVAA